MSDEQNSSNDQQTDATNNQGDQQSTAYTREQVEELIAKAKGDAWAAARAEFRNKGSDRSSGSKTKSETARNNDKGDNKSADPDRLVRILRQRDALDDALAGRTVSAEQRRMLRDLIERTDPDEPDAWAKSFVESFLGGGAAKPDSSNTNSTNTGGNKPPASGDASVSAKPPQSDGGATQSLPPWDRPSNPFEWTAEDLARLEAIKGKREATRILRRKAEEYARTMRIQVLGGQRR